VSLTQQESFKRAHRRANTETGETFWCTTLKPSEATEQNLVPNGRYTVGEKEDIDSETQMYKIHFQNIVQHSGDRLRMNAPGFTVATTRDVDEAYQGPWQGDPVKFAKSPKTTMTGDEETPLDVLVKDTVNTHGVKWAFNYYVKKHGMPPRTFQILAGLVPDTSKRM
jgi:hypothetical protein